ncbi:DUF1697 domain-containing protein [Microbacterium aurantiacum]|uniref:DUF1697 domain-containing protein n=1 Tax=Microbacterium aurantiacum TaxID=162393 RepID=UPI00403759E3
MAGAVALLRGINVGGRNLIRMPELQSAFRDAGYPQRHRTSSRRSRSWIRTSIAWRADPGCSTSAAWQPARGPRG